MVGREGSENGTHVELLVACGLLRETCMHACIQHVACFFIRGCIPLLSSLGRTSSCAQSKHNERLKIPQGSCPLNPVIELHNVGSPEANVVENLAEVVAQTCQNLVYVLLNNVTRFPRCDDLSQGIPWVSHRVRFQLHALLKIMPEVPTLPCCCATWICTM